MEPPATSVQAEATWLQHAFTFISDHLRPVLPGPAPSDDDTPTGVSADQLGECVLRRIQELLPVNHTLPVSYRLVSVSELLSRQHLACTSNLSWSTNQQRAWARGAELSLPGCRVLPRVCLLLIGCLRDGGGGAWRLQDGSGSIRCEVLSPSPDWLNCPVFLPHWNYIPHNAAGRAEDQDVGYVELIGAPAVVCPGPEQGLAAAAGGAGLSGVLGVREAAGLLNNRPRGVLLSVSGRVGVVCPLLVVGGVTFFFFSLTEDRLSLPVLVKERLWWSECVCVGQSVCVTALRVCVLRGWRGNNVLCVTQQSEIHTNYTHTQEHTHTQEATPPPLMTSRDGGDDDLEEAEPVGGVIQSAVRMKQSTVISYQGTVTEVVSEGAGLYVIDRKVGLCLAYQPSPRRKLRAGDAIQLHHVHFLYRPCPDFPPSMLCTCLRSSLRVTAFSRLGGRPPDLTCPGDGALPRLLLQKNMDVSEYLWTCNLSTQLTHSLVSSVVRQQCVCLLSWKLMEFLWKRRRGRRRDIYSEMLDEPHACPLTQYHVDPGVPQYLSVSEVSRSLRSESWSLSSVCPPDGSSLTRPQINTSLSWSCRTLTSDPRRKPSGDRLRQRPLLLVGLLEFPSQASEPTLQFRDATAAMTCVTTETRDDDRGQTAAFNTAWTGCLVCVHQFTMVIERFIQSDFPSYEHLDQDKYITKEDRRVYLQFSLDDVHILSPSAAMLTHLQKKGEEPGDITGSRKDGGSQRGEEELEGGQTSGKKRRREEEAGPSHSTCSVAVATAISRPCVSMVIRVQQKEGVVWRNQGAGLRHEGAGLTPSFSVRAAVIGPVVTWQHDPKNRPMTEQEAQTDRKDEVMLVLSGGSARWFPLLQSGCFYRLIAVDTQDPSVLIGSGVSGWRGAELHTDSTLQVRSDWRIHTLTRPLLLHIYRQAVRPSVLSVSDVLDSRSEVVCFQGVVCDRISVNDRTNDGGDTHSGVRLTVCDQTGRSLQVYLDLSHTPYPPGLLPGNTLLLSGFQRRVSRTGSVYCSFLPVSSVTVVAVGDSSCARPPPAPMMHLGMWAGREQRCIVGQVRGHVVCFLFLQLEWSCSLCGSTFTQCCSSLQCRSTSSIFQSKAKLVIEDGTGEAHVWFSGVLVRALLGLDDAQWEGLQRALRVRGHIRVHPRGRSLVCDPGDPLLHFLFVCSSVAVCRRLCLTCRTNTRRRPEEMKRFTRGDRDFMTRVTPPLQLTCLQLSTDSPHL